MGAEAVRPRQCPEVYIVGADTDEAGRMMKPLQMPLIGGEQELLRSGVSVWLIAWLVGQMPTGGSDG